MTVDQDMVYTGPGEDISLCCHVSGNPVAVVTWIKNNRQSAGDNERITTVNNKTQQHCLRIKNITEEYFGDYICEASNKVGTRRKNIVVVGNIIKIIRIIHFLSYQGHPELLL